MNLRGLGFCLGLAAAPGASADILFSNLGQTENYVLSSTGPGPIWAADLRTGTSACIATSITFQVAFSPDAGQTFRASLAHDNGFGMPRDLIGVFDTTFSVPSLGSGNYTATDAGLPLAANSRFWVLVEVVDGFDGGSALSATLSSLADPSSLFVTEISTPVLFSFDGLIYLPVQLGNLRFALRGTLGSAGAPILAVNAPPGASGFMVNVSGTSGATYTLEATSSLAGTNWVEVRSFTLSGSSTNILDPDATNFNRRYYRAVSD